MHQVFHKTSYERVNEFRRLINQWTDREYLADYFIRHQEKLQSRFWNEIINGDPAVNVEITKAINWTIEEASEFEEEILKLASGTEKGKTLDDIFKPLHKEIRKESDNAEFKAYGIYENSWLRFYAIRYSENLYFISGGGIKLSKKMQESEDLDLELIKLQKVYNYLFNDPEIDPDLLDKLEG
jgi:hypothetical protein